MGGGRGSRKFSGGSYRNPKAGFVDASLFELLFTSISHLEHKQRIRTSSVIDRVH